MLTRDYLSQSGMAVVIKSSLTMNFHSDKFTLHCIYSEMKNKSFKMLCNDFNGQISAIEKKRK